MPRSPRHMHNVLRGRRTGYEHRCESKSGVQGLMDVNRHHDVGNLYLKCGEGAYLLSYTISRDNKYLLDICPRVHRDEVSCGRTSIISLLMSYRICGTSCAPYLINSAVCM